MAVLFLQQFPNPLELMGGFFILAGGFWLIIRKMSLWVIASLVGGCRRSTVWKRGSLLVLVGKASFGQLASI